MNYKDSNIEIMYANYCIIRDFQMLFLKTLIIIYDHLVIYDN